MQRDNQSWLDDLRATGGTRESAIIELGNILRRILPRALSTWLSPDTGHFDALLEDVIQETILRVLDKLDSFEGRSQFTTWVYKIAIRIALNELRHRRWREISLDGLTESEDPLEPPSRWFASDDPHPETVTEQNGAISLVDRILAEELTPRQRAAMNAIGVVGMPMDEVARRMGTNRNALYKIMHDARLKLRRRLRREGYEPEELLALFGK